MPSPNVIICCMFTRIQVMGARALLRPMEESGSNSTASKNALVVVVVVVAPDPSSSSLSQHQLPKHYNIAPNVFSYSIVMNKLRKRYLNNHDWYDLKRDKQIMLADMINGRCMTPNGVCFL